MPIKVPTLDDWRKNGFDGLRNAISSGPAEVSPELIENIKGNQSQQEQRAALPRLQSPFPEGRTAAPAPGSHDILAPPKRFMEEAFVKAFTGYDLAPGKWKPEDELVGTILGEVVGYLGVAKAFKVVGPAIKGYTALRRVRSAKSASKLLTSPKANILSSISKSPFLRNMGTDLGIESAFQVGKLGVGYGSGTETRSKEESAGYVGGILGIVGGFHVGIKALAKGGGAAIKGIKPLLKQRKTPEQVLKANQEGTIVPSDEINPTVLRPKAAEERVLQIGDAAETKGSLDEIRSDELIDAQIDTVNQKAKEISDEVFGPPPPEPKDFIDEDWLESQKLYDHRVPEDIDLADDLAEGITPQGFKRRIKENENLKTKESESGPRRLARAWYGDSWTLYRDLDEAVKKGRMLPQDAERLLDRKNKSLYLTNAGRSSVDKGFKVINEFSHADQEDLGAYFVARAIKDSKIRYLENTGEELIDGVPHSELDEILLHVEKNKPELREGADKINEWANENTLRPLLDEGIIGPQEFERLSNDKYIPRIFFHLDSPEIAELPIGEAIKDEVSFLGGNIRQLTGGPDEVSQPFIGDLKTLMTYMTEITDKTIEKNKQARIFFNILDTNPKNGLVKAIKTGIGEDGIEVSLDPDIGFGKAVFRQYGLPPAEMQVDLNLLRDLEKTDPLVARGTLQMLNTLSGTTLLKSAAVQNNPGFAVFANPFLEIFSQVMGDYKGAYSGFVPKALFYDVPKEFMGALPEALRATAPDTFSKVSRMLGKEMDALAPEIALGKGPTIDLAIRHGLNVRGVSYINNPENYSRASKGLELTVAASKGKIGRQAEKMKDKVTNFTSAPTSISESVFRLMLFKRHLRLLANESNISQEAVLKKPELLDRAARYSNEYFSPGDSAPAFRLLEPVMPFISVGESIFRGQMRSAGKNPKLWSSRLIQFGLASAMIGVRNRLNNPEEWNSISAQTKANNIILFLPNEFNTQRDDGTDQKFYMKLPKDAVSAPVANLFDAMVGGAFFHEDPSKQLIASISKGYRMLNPLGLVSPIVSAGFAFMNYNTFQKREVWNEMQSVLPKDEFHLGRTSKLAYDFGQKTGLSPAKTEAAFSSVFGDRFNSFLTFAGYAYRELTSENPLFPNEGEAREKSVREAKGISRIIRPVPRLDSDAFQALEKHSEISGSKRKRAKDQIQLLFEYQQRTENNSSLSKPVIRERKQLFDKRFSALVKQIDRQDVDWFKTQWKYLKKNGSLQYLTYYKRLQKLPDQERGKAAFAVYETFETPEARRKFYDGLAQMKLRTPEFNKQFLEMHRKSQGTPLFPRREQ